MNMRCLGALSGLGLLVLCTGCATPHRRAEIPRGEWSGSGTFVLEKWSSGDEEGASPLVTQEHGSYPTQLEIGPATCTAICPPLGRSSGWPARSTRWTGGRVVSW